MPAGYCAELPDIIMNTEIGQSIFGHTARGIHRPFGYATGTEMESLLEWVIDA